ncbi:MAG: MBL fold metallo-hydrolase [Acidimicrobiales bacterium]
MPAPSLQLEDAAAEVHRLVVGPLDNNVYVLRCKATGEAVLIDAADEAEQLLELCRELGVRKVLETHGHWDHVQAVPALRQAGFEVGIGLQDAGMIDGHDFVVEDGDLFDVGRLSLRALHTPGHTPGSTCYHLAGSGLLFSGDTLFPGGPGATRNPGGDFGTIIDSIGGRLFGALPDETVVLPGHGGDTTIATERPHLQEWVERGW